MSSLIPFAGGCKRKPKPQSHLRRERKTHSDILRENPRFLSHKHNFEAVAKVEGQRATKIESLNFAQCAAAGSNGYMLECPKRRSETLPNASSSKPVGSRATTQDGQNTRNCITTCQANQGLVLLCAPLVTTPKKGKTL